MKSTDHKVFEFGHTADAASTNSRNGFGAGAVVARDIPDWSVVAGNPGRVIRRRFADDICDALDALAWWDLPTEQVRDLVPLLASRDEPALRDALAAR